MKARAIIPTPAELEAARQLGEHEARVEPRAERIAYDVRNKRLVLHLRRGAIVAIPVERIRWLHGATSRQLSAVYADRVGDAIISDELDMHIGINGLLRELVGLTGAASMMGTQGGKATSPAKTSAARSNGKRGGRPRKKVPA
jgi:hypothetical protein